MEHIEPCHEHLISLEKIIGKAHELVDCCEDMSACCDVLSQGDVIRTLLVIDPTGIRNKVYITDDGTEPVQVPFAAADPIETWLNTTKMKTVFMNGNDIFEMYLNGDIVFRKVLELELPQYTSEINLRQFIDNNNPDGLVVVEIVNNLIQPVLNTYDLLGLEVTLTDFGEFQGLSSGGTGMILTSPMKLLGTGFIRGAGGDGGDGSGFDASGVPSSIGVWESRGSYDDGGPYVSNQMSPLYCNIPDCGRHAYYNRFWKSAGGNCSGAWVHSGGRSGQEYWCTDNRTINHAPIWGDQGPCHFNTSGFWCKAGMYIAVSKAITVSGGSAGNGGAGRGFRVAEDAGWSRGTDGYYSGPTSGFTLTPSKKYMHEGKNISLPPVGNLVGEDGGHGGDWATAGTQSENGTNAGKPAGKSVVGAGFLVAGSVALVEGVNVNGVVVL